MHKLLLISSSSFLPSQRAPVSVFIVCSGRTVASPLSPRSLFRGWAGAGVEPAQCARSAPHFAGLPNLQRRSVGCGCILRCKELLATFWTRLAQIAGSSGAGSLSTSSHSSHRSVRPGWAIRFLAAVLALAQLLIPIQHIAAKSAPHQGGRATSPVIICLLSTSTSGPRDPDRPPTPDPPAVHRVIESMHAT